jgi:hypothetical protein
MSLENHRLCSRFIDHFDADVQTFSLDPIKKQLLNIQTFQKINHSFQK